MTLTNEELRMLGVSSPVLIKMLKTKEERLIAKMYGEFRNGKVDHLTALAELSVIRELIHEINSAFARLENEKGNP